MVAYRLHFEPATLPTIEAVRSGDLGDVILFTSTFAQMLSPENHRAKNGDYAGPVLDMGPYPVNAARYIFGAEPTEVVSAVGTRHPEAGLGDFDDTVAVTLRFPGTASPSSCSPTTRTRSTRSPWSAPRAASTWTPATCTASRSDRRRHRREEEHESFKNTDHFGGEMKYFSDCILNGRDPEPDGEEGYADVRVLEGILAALKSGTSQPLPPFERTKRIDPAEQEETLTAQSSPNLVRTSNPGKDKEKSPKN